MRLNETAKMRKHGAWKEHEVPLKILLRTQDTPNWLNWERKTIIGTKFKLTEGASKLFEPYFSQKETVLFALAVTACALFLQRVSSRLPRGETKCDTQYVWDFGASHEGSRRKIN